MILQTGIQGSFGRAKCPLAYNNASFFAFAFDFDYELRNVTTNGVNFNGSSLYKPA